MVHNSVATAVGAAKLQINGRAPPSADTVATPTYQIVRWVLRRPAAGAAHRQTGEKIEQFDLAAR
jgi:hypothetical protein